jgi:hypothetical protein
MRRILMSVRSYSEREKEVVLHEIPSTFKETPAFEMYMYWGTFEDEEDNIFLFEEAGELVGVVRMYQSSFHPEAIYVGMSASEEYVPEMLRYVEQIKEDDLPIIIRSDAVYPAYEMYTEYGFHEMRRTYNPILKLSTYESKNMNIEIEGYHVVSLREGVLTSSQTEQLVHLVRHCYTITHVVNPVAKFDDARWEKLIHAADVVRSASYVVLDIDREEVVAYAFAHDGGEGTTLELGWHGRKDEINQQVITTLIERQIEYARHYGYEEITGEVDNTDIYSYPLLEEFPFHIPTPMITWKKEVEERGGIS